MSIGVGLLSPAMMLFNRPIRVLLSQMNRNPINVDNDDLRHKALEAHQRKMIRAKILKEILLFLLQELQYQPNRKTVDCALMV